MYAGTAISHIEASMSDKLIVKVKHARMVPTPQPCGYCVPGMQEFFARHNLDFKSFCRHGIDAEVLIATGDAMALEVVKIAKRESKRG